MKKFVLGHRCKKLFLIEACFEEADGDIIMDEEETNHGDFKELPEISLHAILGAYASETMRVRGGIGHISTTVLVDSGSTHNFMSEVLAKKVGLQLENGGRFEVIVASGETLSSPVERFAPETAPASTEPSDGFKSKDVTIDRSKPITARIFLPDNPEPVGDLPVLVYFHGGAFCFGSTTWLGYHQFLGDLSVASQSIVFSVDYRLAPENRLPIAFDDCFASLEWLSHKANSDPWLERADLSRVFLSGDSCGGNIAHHVAIRTIQSKVCHVKIKGLLPVHPYFGTEKRTEREMTDGATGDVKLTDALWRLSLPEGSNRDYYGSNFEMAELSEVEWSEFPAVVVQVAGLDFLKERGVMYAEFLHKKGVKEVKLVEAEGESHVYHMIHPKSEATRVLQKQISEFIHSF
ncbi:hypothetical protein F0562_012232 [Nyssa sinensis]|uniref:Alpha/beta hydrolase fold-3 domain-containing protein n=1 Tax=Nyssa sinensis TaxID=561372 RepID=A0A5J4ZU02_9ASTE|nr:hypothetical protein F0562_012232 [Nyssa sinensis]